MKVDCLVGSLVVFLPLHSTPSTGADIFATVAAAAVVIVSPVLLLLMLLYHLVYCVGDFISGVACAVRSRARTHQLRRNKAHLSSLKLYKIIFRCRVFLFGSVSGGIAGALLVHRRCLCHFAFFNIIALPLMYTPVPVASEIEHPWPERTNRHIHFARCCLAPFADGKENEQAVSQPRLCTTIRILLLKYSRDYKNVFQFTALRELSFDSEFCRRVVTHSEQSSKIAGFVS